MAISPTKFLQHQLKTLKLAFTRRDTFENALIDHFLAFDPSSKVACETLVTTGQVVLAGEVKSTAYLDVQKIARDTINQIGYTKGEYMFDGNSCGVLS